VEIKKRINNVLKIQRTKRKEKKPFKKLNYSVEIKVTNIPITYQYSVISKTVLPGKFSATDTKLRAQFFHSHTICAGKETN